MAEYNSVRIKHW